MTATTESSFGEHTEATEVARAFAPQVKGKTVLITGVNVQGIGFATAEALASQQSGTIIVAGRSLDKVQASIKALEAKHAGINYRPLQLDLSSQRTVRKAAAELLSWDDVPQINLLINSAGIMNLPKRTMNEDDIEMQFATNHIGHFLFTCLIMPKLQAAAKNSPRGATRIVNVTSLSPVWSSMRWSDLKFEKINNTLPESEQPPYEVHRTWAAEDPENSSYLPLEGYNQSKVANLLFSIAANARLYDKFGILSMAVHPGVIQTELVRNTEQHVLDALGKMFESGMFTLKTLGAGAATSLVAALDPGLGKPERKEGKENWGSYLADCQISAKANTLAESSSEAERLWSVSEELVGQKFAW